MNNEQLKTLGEKFIELSGMFIKFIERHGLDETSVDMMAEQGDQGEPMGAVDLAGNPL